MPLEAADSLYRTPQFRREAHLSFSGAGWRGIYHIGVLRAFKDFAPHISERKVLGASAGALVAACLVCDFPIEKAVESLEKVCVHYRSLTLGILHPRFNIFHIVRNDLYENAPRDAHRRASGRLFLSVTRASTLQNELISTYDSRDELIDVLLASCFIPYLSGLIPPKVRGVSYIDGGISCNIPVHDAYTITVSPHRDSGSVIRPRERGLANDGVASDSLLSFCKTVFGPTPSDLIELSRQGYDDAVHFLQRNDLIACHRCVITETRLIHPWNNGNEKEEQQQCVVCDQLVAVSSISTFPRDHLRSLEKAAASEEITREGSLVVPLVKLLALVLFATLYPAHVANVVAKRTLENWDAFVDSVKLALQTGYNNLAGYVNRLGSGHVVFRALSPGYENSDECLDRSAAVEDFLHC